MLEEKTVRALLIAVAVLMPMMALAQTGSSGAGGSSSGAGGSSSGGSVGTSRGGGSGVVSPPSVSPNISPTQTAPVGRSSTVPNVSPTQTAPLRSPSGGRVRPNPSPTQAAPAQRPALGGGTSGETQSGSTPSSGATTGGRTPQEQISDAEAVREREAREARLRASEERLRTLIRDICTGCDYGTSTVRTTTTTNVVRVKG